MTKKKLAVCVLSALMLSSTSAFAATNDLFSDVPADHWAYEAVNQLSRDGIITGYEDGTFKGDLIVTRYEMAQIVANARTHMPQANSNDQELINQLSDEFKEDLESLGVRVTRLEKNMPNVKITGSFGQEYSKAGHEGITDNEGRDYSSRWRKELTLNVDAKVPKTNLGFHSSFVTQFDSNDGAGFNSEENFEDTWNGGNKRKSIMRPETMYVEGPIDKTGLDGKFGTFKTTNVQGGFINNAAVRGIDISHTDDKNTFHVFTGRLDIRDSEVAKSRTATGAAYTGGELDWGSATTGWHAYEVTDLANGTVNWASDGVYHDTVIGGNTYKYAAIKIPTATAPSINYNPSSDNIRGETTSTASTSTPHYADNNEGAYAIVFKDATTWQEDESKRIYYKDSTGKMIKEIAMHNHRKTLTGFAWDHKFNDKFSSSLGYYRYSSAAYDENTLGIYSIMGDYKLTKKLNLHTAFAKGNQGGYDKAWTAEIQFNGAPDMPSSDNHRFGYYLGYRYLAPDALVSTVYEDGAEIGQRGWEGGLFYNFTSNLQGSLKYFDGTSITNPGSKRNKIFTSLYFNF